MATLSMGRSYDLTYDEINNNIEEGRIGNYAYGYINDNGLFVVRYVGRSDSDLKERIKHGITDMENDSSCRYERFKFSYADTVKEAYEKECRNYHDFGGDRGWLVNECHPAKPTDVDCVCPVCEE
jgi:hypothetical protein